MSKTTKPKKTVGRPKKVPPANAVLMRSQTEIDLEHANIKIQSLEEDVSNLETRLDNSYKDQEKMLKELDKCIYATIYHCSEVECNTGKITLHDVDYCVDMIQRILNHKFGYKPKMD